jgi:multidrug resistance efflux pump
MGKSSLARLPFPTAQDLLTIAQLSELYMEAKINEVDVERLFVGQSAYLRFDAIPDFEVEGPHRRDCPLSTA